MTKPDFNDLYKFIVSIGIILVALAITIPWVFLRESFDIVLTLSEFNDLTPAAQQLITLRQESIWLITSNISYISGTLLLFGLGFIAGGSFMWWQRQIILDRKQVLETQKLQIEVHAMTPSEITHKAIQRLKVIQPEDVQFDESLNTMALANYLAIKSRISEKIVKSFQITHSVLTDQKIRNQEVDIILAGKNRSDLNGIVEIRYAPQPIRLDWLRETISNAMMAKLAYQANRPYQVKSVILVTSARTVLEESQIDDCISKLKTEIPLDFPHIRFLAIEDIEKTSMEEWRSKVLPGSELRQATQIVPTKRLSLDRIKSFLTNIEPYKINLVFSVIIALGLVILWGYLDIWIRWLLIAATLIFASRTLNSLRNPLPPGRLRFLEGGKEVSSYPLYQRSPVVKIRKKQLRELVPQWGIDEIIIKSMPTDKTGNAFPAMSFQIIIKQTDGLKEYYYGQSGELITADGGRYVVLDFLDDDRYNTFSQYQFEV